MASSSHSMQQQQQLHHQLQLQQQQQLHMGGQPQYYIATQQTQVQEKAAKIVSFYCVSLTKQL